MNPTRLWVTVQIDSTPAGRVLNLQREDADFDTWH